MQYQCILTTTNRTRRPHPHKRPAGRTQGKDRESDPPSRRYHWRSQWPCWWNLCLRWGRQWWWLSRSRYPRWKQEESLKMQTRKIKSWTRLCCIRRSRKKIMGKKEKKRKRWRVGLLLIYGSLQQERSKINSKLWSKRLNWKTWRSELLFLIFLYSIVQIISAWYQIKPQTELISRYSFFELDLQIALRIRKWSFLLSLIKFCFM